MNDKKTHTLLIVLLLAVIVLLVANLVVSNARKQSLDILPEEQQSTPSLGSENLEGTTLTAQSDPALAPEEVPAPSSETGAVNVPAIDLQIGQEFQLGFGTGSFSDVAYFYCGMQLSSGGSGVYVRAFSDGNDECSDVLQLANDQVTLILNREGSFEELEAIAETLGLIPVGSMSPTDSQFTFVLPDSVDYDALELSVYLTETYPIFMSVSPYVVYTQ